MQESNERQDPEGTLRKQIVEIYKAGKTAEARGLCERYLSRHPDDAQYWSLLGAWLRADNRHDQSLRAQQRAFALSPDSVTVQKRLANILTDVGQYEQALQLRLRLLQKTPSNAEQKSLVGKALRGQGRYAEAIAYLREAAKAHPKDADVHIQLALTELADRRYVDGFRNFEFRWQGDELKPRQLAKPQWDGGPLEGKRIAVLPEQGFGDMVAFARFLPALRHFNPARVMLICQKPLLRLLEDVDGADWVGLAPNTDKDFDVWTNVIDLAQAHFKVSSEIPPPLRLKVPADANDRARTITEPFAASFRVGIVWSGSTTYRANAFRSFSHTEFQRLVDIPGLQMFSLYKGPLLDAFVADGMSPFIIDAGSSERDFADCAAAMLEMDLIITCDTAAAHIAGSLGVPVWNLLHWDPFWLYQHRGEATPWYPSMRLIRQEKPRDWAGVFEKVRTMLVKEIERRSAKPGAIKDILTPTSPGELLDKLSILKLKSERIGDEAKLKNVRHERALLEEAAAQSLPQSGKLQALNDELYAINGKLWEIEDDIRACEAQQDFGARFIELARSVYLTNDRRAAVKKEINLLLGSAVIEEKSYHPLAPAKAP